MKFLQFFLCKGFEIAFKTFSFLKVNETEIKIPEIKGILYRTVWSGELKYNQKVSYDIDSGDYCIRIKGTRVYLSGTEKEIDETCGKGNPVEFRNCDTILFSWDGKILRNKGEIELD